MLAGRSKANIDIGNFTYTHPQKKRPSLDLNFHLPYPVYAHGSSSLWNPVDSAPIELLAGYQPGIPPKHPN